ncbi:MAG: hypothetical protein ACOX2U_00490 [Limisphaerales bacterium]|jgi:hypothetical protein|nr:hypothetical protein [Verrucomicrobiota bacterium]
MVEIALCLAIVGFALVVIMGVLPLGGQAQKKNRENTLSLIDGNYLLEAITHGARGYDDLGLYVDEILLYSDSNTSAGPQAVIQNNVSDGTYWGTREIVGLLTAPRFLLTSSNVWVPNYLNNNRILGNSLYTNMTCRLKMRSMSGSSSDKGNNEANRDFGMAYLVDVDVLPLQTNVLNMSQLDKDEALLEKMKVDRSLSQNVYQVSVTLSWPLRRSEKGGYSAGANSQVFRTLVSGSMTHSVLHADLPGLGARDVVFWYFNGNEFSVTNNTAFYDDLAK